MADKELLARIDKLAEDPKVKAMLTAIGHSEGAGDRYNVHFGGKVFSDMSKHPGASDASILLRNGNRIYPTAAGRYQIIKSTWDNDAKVLGLKDFSQQSQDRAAIYELIKAGAIDKLEKGDVEGAFSSANRVWASLPSSTLGNVYNGKTRKMDWVLDVYNNALKTATPAPSPTQSFLQGALSRLGYGTNSSFLNSAVQNYKNKSYGNAGVVPFNMYTGNKIVTSADTQLTPETTAELRAKLLNKDPNVSYGVSFVGSSLRPTEVVTNSDGTKQGYFEVTSPSSVTGAPHIQPPLDSGVPVTAPVLEPDVDLLNQQPASSVPPPSAYNYSGVTTQVDPLQVLVRTGDPKVEALKEKIKLLS